MAAAQTKEARALLEAAQSFDEVMERAMGEMEAGEFRAAQKLFEKSLAMDRKFEGNDISTERADVAYNLGCCFAQLRDFDAARTWLRRAVLWGVKDVDPSVDEHLAPMRETSDWSDVLESFLPPVERVPAAVLLRSRRHNAGRNMEALAKAMEDEEEEESDDDDSFAQDEKDDDDARDVFDSDFDESEDDDDDEDDEAKASSSKKTQRQHSQKKENKAGGRAAARAAREINALAVQNHDSGDDDSDDDFKDAAADEALKAAPESSSRLLTDAADAERRKRKVDAAFRDVDGSDDDLLDAPKKKTKLLTHVVAPPTALEVLSELFGERAAAKILARARKARRARIKSAPTVTVREAARSAVTSGQVLETRTFAGETITLARRADAPSASSVTKKAGIDAVLDELKGPKAVTAVAKSAYDWDTFKQQQGLEDSLRDASRKGFLANQDFLNRVDHRQFERERDAREQQRNEAAAAAPGAPPPAMS